MKDGRYPITISQNGNTKTLKVRPPCLSLVDTKTQTVRVHVVCCNCWQSQVVVKQVNRHSLFEGKITAEFRKPAGAFPVAEELFEVSGMMLTPKDKCKATKFVDESPIFAGLGADIKSGSFSEVCIGSNKEYFFLKSGRFVKRSDEKSAWDWNVPTTSEMETFLKKINLHSEYFSKLKDYRLPQLATMCFIPHFRADWYGLVKSETHRSMFRKELEAFKLPNRRADPYRDMLKFMNRKTPLHKLPNEDWALINIMTCSLKVRPSELKKTLQASYSIDLTSEP